MNETLWQKSQRLLALILALSFFATVGVFVAKNEDKPSKERQSKVQTTTMPTELPAK